MLTVSELKAVLSVPKNELISYTTGTDPENPFILPPPVRFQEILDLFAAYLYNMEDFVDAETQKLKKDLEHEEEKAGRRVTEQLTKYGEVMHDEYGNLNALEYFSKRVDEFANILRKSFFSNLYGFFESQLEQLCHSLEQLCDSLENYNQMAQWPVNHKLGSVLYPAKPFLKKIGFPLGDNLWSKINDYRRLRNCIIHCEGRIDRFGDEMELRKYIDRTKTLSISGNEVVLLKGFCEEALHTLQVDFYRGALLFALVNWWSCIS